MTLAKTIDPPIKIKMRPRKVNQSINPPASWFNEKTAPDQKKMLEAVPAFLLHGSLKINLSASIRILKTAKASEN